MRVAPSNLPQSFCLAFICLLFAMPVVAQDQDDRSEMDMARLITGGSLPSDCLAPVAINVIDGEKQAVSARQLLIQPGFHSISGLTFLDTSKCDVPEGEIDMMGRSELEMIFEAGKTYYIAYDRSSSFPQDWKLMVWKEEQTVPGPGFSID